jgi:nicotinate phosphoribosyltransferase
VAKRSQDKQSRGGRKYGIRRHRPSGTAVEEVVRTGAPGDLGPGERPLQVPLLREGKRADDLPTLAESRDHLRRALVTVPWDGMKLSRGEPAIPTVFEEVHP